MWAPPEDRDPVVFHAPTRKSIACFGAISLRSGKFIHAMSPMFNSATFEAYPRKLLRHRCQCQSEIAGSEIYGCRQHRSRGKRMVMVPDNA